MLHLPVTCHRICAAATRQTNLIAPAHPLTPPQVLSPPASLAYLSLAHKLGAGKVLAYQLSTDTPLPSAVRPRGALRGMTASPSGRFLAAPDKFSLWVWAAGEDGERRPVNFHHVRQYTVSGCLCVVCAHVCVYGTQQAGPCQGPVSIAGDMVLHSLT